MRILAATPYYEPEGGGLERYAHEILSRLAARGHEVRVVCFSQDGPAQEILDGVHIRRFPPSIRLSNTPVSLGFRAQAAAIIEGWRPDIVVVHTPVPFAAEMVSSAARSAGIPYVVTYHAGRLGGPTPGLRFAAAVHRATLERRMLGGSTRLIAVSTYVQQHALRRQRDRVTVIPPGVDATLFAPVDASLFVPVQTPSAGPFLFIGPLDAAYRWKGVDVLLDAFEAVHRRHPTARLHLVGDGDRFTEIAARVCAMGPAVTLLGRLSMPDLVREYQRCTALVLPSLTDAEAFGMVLAEANACGRPVIASRVGGIPDFVSHGKNGLLVEPGDPDGLAGALASLLNDPQAAVRMGDEGRRRVVADHDWDSLAATTEQVLVAACRGSPLVAEAGHQSPSTTPRQG